MPLQVLDASLPAWLQFNGQYRNRVEQAGHIGFKPGSDVYDLSQLRLSVAIQPVTWFRIVGEAQDSAISFNSRIASAPPYQNRWDVRQAFVEFGSDRSGWIDAIVGREMLSFGDERFVGPANWLNNPRTFDVARVDLHHPGFRTSIFASSVVVARDGVIDHHLQGNNFYGIYNTFDKLVPKAEIDPYVFWRVAPANVTLSENGGRGALNEVTTGFRAAGKLPLSFDYNVEMAVQRGSLGPYSIQSWAGHWALGYRFTSRGTPRVYLETNHASGTKSQTGPNWGTFDQLYASAHDKMDFADQVGFRNIHQVRTGVEVKIAKSWTLTSTYEAFWRASRQDGLYTASGALTVPASPGTSGRFVGQEANIMAVYDWRKAVEFGLGYGHLFPGRFLQSAGRTAGYNYPFIYMTWFFTNTRGR
jgi:hypothetical protein